MGVGGLGGVFERFGGSGADSSELEPDGTGAPEGATEEAQPQPEPGQEQSPQAPLEPVPPAVPAEAVPPGHVPLAALLDVRDRAQRAEQELSRYRQQQSTAAPSIYDHPDGPEAAIAEQMQQAQTNMRFEMSERFAVNAHGAEIVKEAQEWAVRQDPFTKQAILNDPDPVGSTVTRYRQSQALAKVGSDPDAYARTWAEQNGYVKAGSPSPAPAPQPQGQQPAAQPKPAAPSPPPPSLATAPGAPGSGLDDAPAGSALGGLKFKLDR